MYIVQLYKENWAILRMLGSRGVVLPSTERIVSEIFAQITHYTLVLAYLGFIKSSSLYLETTKPVRKDLCRP